jgi:hypothetical protein
MLIRRLPGEKPVADQTFTFPTISRDLEHFGDALVGDGSDLLACVF